MKKGLVLVIVLLCVASLMAAMAYNNATVTNDAFLKVVNTSEALITLQTNAPWDWGTGADAFVGRKDLTATMVDGELSFQFGKGINGGNGSSAFYGLQPNSVYEWSPLFTFRNKSAETLDVTLSATGDFAQYITFGTCSQSTYNNPTWGTQGLPYTITNVPKETNSGMQNIRNITVRISIPSGHVVSTAELLGSIQVSARAHN